ncbi:F-box/LRR-repeat protein 25 [Linum perenne]
MKKAVSSAAAVDRISELPEGIIHGILARLESHESAARTSILSKRWLRLWSTFPVVEFKGDYGFQSFAAATSKRLLAAVPPLPLDSFNIDLQLEPDFEQLRQCLNQLLDGGRSSPIKVVVENNKDISASHVGGMLLTCHRTKFLDLKGFDLSRLHSFKTCLDNLQELSLEHIQVSRQSFPSCLANAPRLEKLKLKYIIGIDSLDISASNFPSLVSLEFVGFFPYLQQLQLSSDTLLQTLRFVGRCKFLKLVSAPNVKTVHLSPLDEFGCSELEKLISKFPSLESLYFNAMYISGKFKLRVSSPTLRELTFKQLVSKMEFEIDTPNLETLTIDTTTLDINSTVINVHPSCRFVFDCAITSRITTSWFIKLNKCLAALATRFPQLVFKLDITYSTKVCHLCNIFYRIHRRVLPLCPSS